MTARIVSVMGATGVQGASVIDTLLKDSQYTIRAITRNTSSKAAQALAARGIEVVQADANDVSSLTSAFAGSHAIYAITNFFEPFGQHGPEKAMEAEEQQGINIAQAAAATPSLTHYIWSTLPDANHISGGKYLVPHFESKNRVDRYIHSQPALLAKTTFLWVGFYAQNMYVPLLRPIELPTAPGTWVQLSSTPADVPIPSIGDAPANIGLFIRAILEQPRKTLPGKFVLAHVEVLTAGEILQAWGRAQGKKVQYLQVGDEAYNSLWPLWAEEMGLNMKYFEFAKEKSFSTEGELLTKDDLEIEGLIGAEEAFAKMEF